MMEPSLEPLRGARVLVTGAAGFIGRHVVAALCRRGADVTAVVRAPMPNASVFGALPVRCIAADLTAPAALRTIVATTVPAVLLQLAGHGVAKHERDPAAMQQLHCDLVGEACAALLRVPVPAWRGVRLVQVGSALEYGALPVPPDEAVIARPTTDYGRSKLAGTAAVQAAVRDDGLPALVARPFTVFGPGERPGRLFPTLLAARGGTGPVALSSGEQQRDFALVFDVAEALADLACAPAAEVLRAAPPFDTAVINVATGRLATVRAFATAAAAEFGIAPERLAWGALPPLPDETAHAPVPVARLASAIGRSLPADLAALCARVRRWLDAADVLPG